jgi:hypothetical protein
MTDIAGVSSTPNEAQIAAAQHARNMADYAATLPAAPVVPAEPAEALARIAQLKADPVWREKWMTGGPTQTREYQALFEVASRVTADPIEAAMAGFLENKIVQSSDHIEMIGAANWLRETGISDGVIREILSGKPVTQEAHDAAVRWKADHMRDSDWRNALLGGKMITENGIRRDPRRDLLTVNYLITTDIRKDAAA